ncbi:hypothetical protein Anapl_04648 [Anas platyrhynchos]|uniref:Uncharacterized protein n=1 Tax=Anas platyrhynchos TaxID=8839 RepID=R0LUE5_ANAPL|nr:hypothetical protein Anapl_04648 [Anas platyrhynchos]
MVGPVSALSPEHHFLSLFERKSVALNFRKRTYGIPPGSTRNQGSYICCWCLPAGFSSCLLSTLMIVKAVSWILQGARDVKGCPELQKSPAMSGERVKKIRRLLQLMPVREETTPICVKGIRIRALQTDIHSEPHRNQTTIVMTEHENDSCRTGQGAQSDGKAIQKASLLPEQKPPNFYPEFIYA